MSSQGCREFLQPLCCKPFHESRPFPETWQPGTVSSHTHPSRPSSLSQVSEKNEALLLNIPTLATGGEVRNRVSWHPESQADPSAEQSPGQSLSTRLPELWTQPDKTPLGDLWGNLYLRYMFWHSWERDGTAQVKTQSSPQCLAFRRCVTVQVRLSLLHQGGETWANGLGDLWAWGHPFPY